MMTVLKRCSAVSLTHAALLMSAAVALAGGPAQAVDPVETFLAEARTKASAAESAKRDAIVGQDGWLFFVPELRALSVGPFWGPDATKVSRSSKSDYADPLPAIVDFNDQLKKAGIELLVVPVPAKAAVVPERFDADVAPAAPAKQRFDPYQRQFYDLLKQRGVTVIDLLPRFIEQSDDDRRAMYCQTDSHWSGIGVALAAKIIAEQLEDRPWRGEVTKHDYDSDSRVVEISGDLARMVDESNPARERLPLEFVGVREGKSLTPIGPDRESPVLLMGDSHTLVFHDPELFATGAGLPDHLALRLGVPIDLIGVRGSGATTTRIELLRRRDNLKGKKVVIWCFSFREFTESFSGWRKVPVIR
jgi:hypothetical protein